MFLAYDKEGARVAVKILHPQLAVTVTADRFLREISFLSKLDHPRLTKLVDWGESEWLVYYVMAFVEGPTLRETLTRNQTLPITQSIDITRELLDALGYAHERGIVHRDVKPENIVLTERGAMLVDFGIARAVAESGTDRLTRSGHAVGTSAYMSPEQVEGALDIDHRSDLYSLGCVLFECLAGQPPFSAEREDVIQQMRLDDALPSLRELRSEVPPGLARVLERALATPRADRWQSAQEMDEALTAER